ncbi:unnamed protein product, partial [Polarella glacialis]
SKTRDRLLRDQKSYIYQLFGLVRQRRPEGATDSKEDDAGEDKKAEQDEEAEEQEDGDEGLAAFGRGLSAAAVAAYAGVDGDSPSACLLRCEELLAAALAGIRPAARAEEALEGLLGLLPPESSLGSWELDLDCLRLVVRLVPTAAAALAVFGEERPPAAWRRFLGLVLSAPLRIEEELSGAAELEVREVSARLGSLVSLLASPAAARSALRVSLAALGPSLLFANLLGRMALAVPPVLPSAFGGPLSERG